MCNPKTKGRKKMKAARDETCEKRIDDHLRGRLADLRRLFDAYQRGEDDHERFCDYGLSFDFVAADTFPDQREAYFRYQLSWGGPSDEFRFFAGPDYSCHRIEYWFLDWFDGACRVLSGHDEDDLYEIWRFFRESGLCESKVRQ
jgi:hypothetical protein